MKDRQDIIRDCRLMEIVVVTFLRGDGTDENVFRLVTQYHSKDGKLLAEEDAWLRGRNER